jgi:hypothetical protein
MGLYADNPLKLPICRHIEEGSTTDTSQDDRSQSGRGRLAGWAEPFLRMTTLPRHTEPRLLRARRASRLCGTRELMAQRFPQRTDTRRQSRGNLGIKGWHPRRTYASSGSGDGTNGFGGCGRGCRARFSLEQ